MAKIKKIKEGTATVYPATIPQAVIDPTSGKSVRTELNEKEAVANKKQTVTNSATDYPSGAAVTASLALKTDTAELNKIYPLYNYNVRVGTDSGSIGNIEELAKLYNENLALLDSTVFLWSGVAGMKTRTSGSNVFASKLYNMANKVQQFGANLVTNGTFTGADGSTPAGWASVNSAVLTVDSNRLKIYNTSAYGGAHTSFTTIIGKTYHLTGTFTLVDCNGEITASNTSFGTPIVSSGSMSSSKTVTLSFVATSTTTYVNLANLTSNVDKTSFFDNISVKQMDWIDGTNDAVQTTEANQPYVGGVIAPNEVRKIKTFNNINRVSANSQIIFSSNDSWSLTGTILLNNNGTGAIVKRLFNGDSSDQIRLQGGLYFISTNGNSVFEVIGFELIRRNVGKVITFTVVARGGSMSTYLNGVLVNTLTIDTAYSFKHLYTEDNQVYNLQIHNRALSASEIQAQHDYLRLQIPEIEGIAIGNQYWQTSNYEGVVAGDGSVIPEVQNSDNVELITNAADRDFSSDTGWWTKGAGVTIADGVCHITSQATNINAIKRDISSLANKRFKITFTILNYVSGYLSLSNISNSSTQYNSNETYTVYGIAAYNQIALFAAAGTQLDIDNISFEEVGWSQSTALYDAIYAQTSGTAAVKELAALKAAAMWCNYNNDVNNGAIYGKLYNWYAVKLISLYPPTGYRIPSSADFTQLTNYLGGASVAGGRLKKEGFAYWDAPNTGATNESGFSSIGNGWRAVDARFSEINQASLFATSNSVDANNTYYLRTRYDASAILELTASSKIRGYSLRLLRNSPVGPNERMETSGIFDTNIASTPKQIPISFGYTVDCIRITNLQPSGGTNLTSVEAKLHDAAGTAIATLITGKTVNVASTMVYNISAEHAAMLQDGTVRVTATGNLPAGMVIEVVLKKATF